MLRTLVICAALVSLVGACGDEGNCTTDADCSGQQVCSFNVCTISTNADGQGIVDIDLPCEAAQPGDLILTEILADPGGMDVNGDGSDDSADNEFVEVLNVSDHEVGIANVLISVVTSSTKQVQLGLECLPAKQARVLFGAEKGLSLRNSSGTVSLIISGEVVQSHTYGSEADGDQSLTLSDQLDAASAWVQHNEVSSDNWSPGVCPNGNGFPDCEGDAPIPDVVDACGEAPGVGELVINEVKAHGDEFVEIVNRDLRPFALDGLSLHDALGERFAFAAGQCIEPGQVLVLVDGYDPANPEDPITMMVPDGVLAFDASLSLNDGGDIVSLRNASDAVLDEMAYGSGEEISAPNGESMTRIVQLDPASAFPDCPVAGPGDATDGVETIDVPAGDGDTDDVGPSCGTVVNGPDMLVINEVLINPGTADVNCDDDPSNTQDEFVEIVNITSDPLDLSGVQLLTGESGSTLDLIHSFGAWCLEPKQGVVLFGGGSPAICEEQSSVNTSDKGLSLNNAAGHVVKLVAGDGAEVDSMTYTSVPDGESWVRYPEGSGDFVLHGSYGSCAPVVPESYCALGVAPCLANCALEFSPGACLDGSPLPFCL
jgi:hypothetical protein